LNIRTRFNYFETSHGWVWVQLMMSTYVLIGPFMNQLPKSNARSDFPDNL